MSRYQITLPLIDPKGSIDPAANALLEAGKKAAKGMLPNMYLAMANTPAVLSTYLHGYGLLREQTTFTVAELEIVFLVISRENGCDYCVAAHSLLADLGGIPREFTDAIRDGLPLPDPKLESLSQFTRQFLLSRGMPEKAEVDRFLAAGFTEHQVLELILAISVKTLSNYVNHVFDTKLDPVMKVREYSAFKLGQKVVSAFKGTKK